MKLPRLIAIALMMFTLMGCGSDTAFYTTTPTQTVYVSPTPAAYDVQSDVNAIIADENNYRQGLGQSMLAQGLSCTLYKITGGQFIQNDSTHTPTLTGITTAGSWSYSGVFDQENDSTSAGLNVLPPQFFNDPSFQNLILLRCQGQIVVTETNYYQFDLTSDDGSVLYLDGSRLIDNDGNHGATEKFGTKYLRRGVHAFRIDFAQTGGGAEALILKANGSLIPGMVYFH